MTPDLIYDQMIAAGVARKLIFSWLGNPGVGGLDAIRRRIEGDGRRPQPLELEEYSHFGMVGRYTAGAMNLPFFPLRSLLRDRPAEGQPADPADRVALRRRARSTPCRRSSPDVTIVHAQRADAAGNTQVWGLLGCQKEAAFAADRVIVVVEELVDEAVIRADPNRTIIPGPDRRRGRRRAVRRASLVRPGRLRPRQPLLPRVGRDHARRGRARRPGSTSGSTASPAARSTSSKLGAERAGARSDAGLRALRLGRLRGLPMSDATARPRLHAVRDDDRGRRARAGRPARLLRRRRPAEHRGQPRQADGRAGPRARLRGGRLRRAAGAAAAVASATRRSSPARPRSISMFELFGYYLQGGLIDVGFLGAAQIDRFGNINTTVIGDYDAPDDAPARLAAARARSRSTPARSS